jgi:hypothetical protein
MYRKKNIKSLWGMSRVDKKYQRPLVYRPVFMPSNLSLATSPEIFNLLILGILGKVFFKNFALKV